MKPEKEKILKTLSDLVDALNNMLKEYDDINLYLSDEYVKIMDEVDDKGKSKFSNSEKREHELKLRFNDLFLKRLELRRHIEITRLLIQIRLKQCDVV